MRAVQTPGMSGRNQRKETAVRGMSVPRARVDSLSIPEIGAAPDFLLKLLLEMSLSQKAPKTLTSLS